MAKPYVTVELILHGEDTPVTITDYVDNSGRFVAIGTQAAAMLERHEAIHYVDAEGVETIIPYHAIVAVNITKESDDYTKPDDEYCEDAVIDRQSWVIKFYDGETFLYETIVNNGDVPVYGGTTPTKEGYTFLGWNSDSSAQTALEELPAATEAASYYAIFEQDEEPDPDPEP